MTQKLLSALKQKQQNFPPRCCLAEHLTGKSEDWARQKMYSQRGGSIFCSLRNCVRRNRN